MKYKEISPTGHIIEVEYGGKDTTTITDPLPVADQQISATGEQIPVAKPEQVKGRPRKTRG